MKLKPVLLLAAVVSLIGVNGASASSRHHHEHFARQSTSTRIANRPTNGKAASSFTSHRVAGYRVRGRSYASYGYAPEPSYESQETSRPAAYSGSGHYSNARPSAWCGWEMRQLVGSDPGPEYNLARNWAHWGHAVGGPAPGVIGVMAHHVFKVVSVLGNGEVLAISGNDSHAVRTRPRSTSGVIAWRGA
jgi:hypothetical protein